MKLHRLSMASSVLRGHVCRIAAATVVGASLASCADVPQIAGSRETGGAVVGGAAGAIAGNVLGYMLHSDRSTATILGALIGAGVGYWQGYKADERLRQAEVASRDVHAATSQSPYRYDNQSLYSRPVQSGAETVATFDRLETPIPIEAVNARSRDASSVLRRLGALAVREGSPVVVEAPSESARNYMVSELRAGAGTRINVTTRSAGEAKVIVGRVPG